MAGKRGKEIQLQREIETQEEWEDMMSKEGLCVIDVYQEWCGAAVGMIGTFRRIKNEIGDPLLKFVIAKSDNIDALEKYRGRCEPCFLFYAGGMLVSVVRGANAPLILRTITEQLAQEHKVIDGQAERKEIKDTMIAQLEERDKQQQEEEEQQEEARRMKFQGEIIDFGDELDPYSELKKEVSVVIIKPDAVESGKADDILKEMEKRGIEILRQEERQLTDEEVRNVYTHLQDEPYFDELVTFMTSSPSIVLAITKGKTGENIIKEFRELIGPTEVEEAKEQAPDSLRAQFGSEKYMNAVHGSDSTDTAARELAFFFPDFVAPPVAGKTQIQRTLALIRPDAYKKNKDEILEKIREAGFKVAMQKEIHLNKEQAEDFYSEHQGQEYFEELTTRMSCGPLLALGLAREEAVTGWRDLLGPTQVEEAKATHPQSLRAQFSEEGAAINMLHGSDTPESAQKEIQYFFPIEQTVAVIKPDAYGTKDEIIEKIHESGFRIAARKETTLSREIAEEFYADHKDKEYYNDLVEHMISGPTYFMVLSREAAVDGWRSLIGATDPSKAKEEDPESLRSLFGKDTLQNALHGSSDPEHAKTTIAKIFGELHFNKDGTLREDNIDEAVIAEQQEISYESAPEYGGKTDQENSEESKEEGKASPKPAEKQESETERKPSPEPAQQQATEEQTPEEQQKPQEGESQETKEVEPEAEKVETTEDKPKTPEPKAETTEPDVQQEEQTEAKPSEEAAETKQDEPAEKPKVEEEPKVEQEPKQEEEPKVEEAPKVEEEQQVEEAPKVEEEQKVEEAPKVEEEEPKKEETEPEAKPAETTDTNQEAEQKPEATADEAKATEG